MSRRLERLFDEVVKTVPTAIREAGLKPNACILATRLGVEALRAASVTARPLSVKLQVMNPLYLEMVQDLELLDNLAMVEQSEHDERAEQWREKGAWSIVLGYGGHGGWDGHLIAIAQERYLLDFTAGQVARLHKGIKAEPFWAEARDLARGEHWGGRSEDGCLWLYQARSQDKSFLKLPAWSGYRVSVRGRNVVSERTRIADVPVAPAVSVPIPGGSR